MLEVFNLEGKIALVTGGGSGLGRSMSLALSNAGAEVIVAGRRTDKLENVIKEIKDKGGDSFWIVLDIQDENSINSSLKKIETMGKKIDILVKLLRSL